MPARREVLKGSLALTAAAAVPTGVSARASAGAPRYLVDTRLPEAARLAQRALRGGHALHDPRREIVHLLLSPEWRSLGGPVIGLTTWSDFALAQDLLRTSLTPVRHAVALDGPNPGVVVGAPDSSAQRLLAELLGPSPRHPDRRATSFLWLA